MSGIARFNQGEILAAAGTLNRVHPLYWARVSGFLKPRQSTKGDIQEAVRTAIIVSISRPLLHLAPIVQSPHQKPARLIPRSLHPQCCVGRPMLF